MTDFSYPGASSFNNVPLGSYVDSRPTTGLSYSPKKKSGSAPNSPMALNGRYTPRSAITPLRRDSQDTNATNIAETSLSSPPPTLFPSSPTEALIDESKWFKEQLRYRKLVSGVWTGAAGYVILLAAFLALQISLWSPLKSVSAIIWGLFSLKLHSIVVMISTVLGVLSFFLATLLAKLDQQKSPSMARPETWIAWLLSFMFYTLAFFTGVQFFFDYSLVKDIGVFHFLFVMGTMITSAVNVFSHDYQLLFGGLKLKNMVNNTFNTLIVNNIHLSATQSLYQGIKVLACASISSFFLVPFFYGFSGWLFVFNLSAHYALIVVFAAQILIGHVFHRILRQKVLEPIRFPFPPPYAIACPSPAQRRNMCAMLQTSDPLLKLFALFDLRHIAWYDAVRRGDVFALSQPANHPRNWKVVFIACHEILENLKNKIEAARNKLSGIDLKESENGDSEDEDYVNRNMLLMPPSARGQLYSARSRNRHQTALKPHKKVVYTERTSLEEKISKWTKYVEETGLLSRSDAEMAILVIEALDMLVINSLSQDRYGVLQKDLTSIMRDFLGLYNSIDRYLRTKGFTQESTNNESLMRGVEDVLVSAMTRIGEKFTNNMKSFGLNTSEVRQLEGIISHSALNA